MAGFLRFYAAPGEVLQSPGVEPEAGRMNGMEISSSLRLAIVALGLCGSALCSNITYNVDLTNGEGTVSGYIVTDGVVGPLAGSGVINGTLSGDILDWNLHVTGPCPPATCQFAQPFTFSANLGPGGILITNLSDSLTATASQLLFNFSGANDYLLFEGGPGSADIGNASLCFSNAAVPCLTNGDTGTGESLLVGTVDVSDNLQFASLSGLQVIGTASSAGSNAP